MVAVELIMAWETLLWILEVKNLLGLECGTDKPEPPIHLADYVLMKLNKEEEEKIEKAIDDATNAVIEIITNGCQSAMNLFN